MGNITEALRKHRLKTAHKSLQYSEQREAATAQHGELVRGMLSGKAPASSLSVEAQALRSLYYDMLRDYKGDQYAIPKPLTKRGEALWTRVDAARKRAGVDPKQFMKAQFAWFDKAFGRAPSVEQLTTDAAITRVSEVGEVTRKRIVGRSIEADIDLASIFRQSEKLLQDMMRAQSYTDRTEFYKDFVLTGVFTFDKRFLDADPAYRRARVG